MCVRACARTRVCVCTVLHAMLCGRCRGAWPVRTHACNTRVDDAWRSMQGVCVCCVCACSFRRRLGWGHMQQQLVSQLVFVLEVTRVTHQLPSALPRQVCPAPCRAPLAPRPPCCARRRPAPPQSFMCHSGINDFPNVAREDIAAALPFLKRRGLPFFVHAEVVSPVDVPEVRRIRCRPAWAGGRMNG